MSKIDEVLLNGIKAYEGGDKLVFSLDPIKQQLLELLESCKPEIPPYPVESDELQMLHDGAVQGFHDATQQYHSNIRKLFDGN